MLFRSTARESKHDSDQDRTETAVDSPSFFAVDSRGYVYWSDFGIHVIRRYDPKTKELTRIAGSGKKGATLTGDALTSELSRPHGVTIAPDGALIITDSYNDRILRIEK